jgi:hypothetical protein
MGPGDLAQVVTGDARDVALKKISREFTGSHEIPYESCWHDIRSADETSMMKQGSDLRNAPNLLRFC